jgi:hypothetical protein
MSIISVLIRKYVKPVMVAHAYRIPGLVRQRQEDNKSEATLCYTVSSRQHGPQREKNLFPRETEGEREGERERES